MRRSAFIAILLCSGSPALHAAPPNHDNVVMIEVHKVLLPSHMPGLCNVSGIIGKVWEGKAFRPGEPITLKVPCSGGVSYRMPAQAVTEDRHFTVIAADVLLKSKQGVARLDDTGALVWKPTSRSYGTFGAVWGYRVVDGAMIPAAPG